MSALNQHLNAVGKLQKQDSEVDVSSLAGKTLLLYFSASWCPPCRGFTPQLSAFYNKYHAEKNFEVIFATWDEKEEAFEDYYATMPWCAIPFSHRRIVDALNELFEVESIPTLIALNADTGAVVSTRARHEFEKDPEGLRFPWRDCK